MKITVELNCDEFDMALDSGALKALSMTMKKPDKEKVGQTLVNTPTAVPAPMPVQTSPIRSTQVPVQSPVYAQTSTTQNMAPVPAQPTQAPQMTTPVQCQAGSTITAPTVPTAPTAQAPTYTLDDIARAAAQLMDAGKQQPLLTLLRQFQVQGLRDLRPEQLGAFATALRQIGARI